MEDVDFSTTFTLGRTNGSGQTGFEIDLFSKQLLASQSFDAAVTLNKPDNSAYDISSATVTAYITAYKDSDYEPVLLGSGSLSDSGSGTTDTFTVEVDKDTIPEDLGDYDGNSRAGNAIIKFEIEDSDSKIVLFQRVMVLDSDFGLSNSVNPTNFRVTKNDQGNVLAQQNTPPVSPSLADKYLVGTSPTGDWASNANNLTTWNGADWLFAAPTEGMWCYDENTSTYLQYNGTTWGELIPNDPLTYKGVIDASSNPNYPAADAGHTYKISVAGKIGGASGVNVEVGDMIICNTDSSASGDEATVGANWNILQSNLDVSSFVATLLNDADAATFRASIGAMSELSEDATPQVGGSLDFDNNLLYNLLGIGLKTATSKTISSDTFTQDQLAHTVLNESGDAADDLVSVTPATNQTLLILTMGNASQVPTIKHGTGTNQFSLQDDTDLEMKMHAVYFFWHNGTVWRLIGGSSSGSSSGSGGGGYQPTSTATLTHSDSPYTFDPLTDIGKLFIIGSSSTSKVKIIVDPADLADYTEFFCVKCRSDKGYQVEVSDTVNDFIDNSGTDRHGGKGEPMRIFLGDDGANNIDTFGGGL